MRPARARRQAPCARPADPHESFTPRSQVLGKMKPAVVNPNSRGEVHMRRGFGLIGLLVTAVLLGIVGVSAYNVGWSDGAATHVAAGTVAPPYYYGYGPGPGFGIFGFFWFLFVPFILF